MNKIIEKDVIIIGGGAAGLAAAVECRKKGITDILIIERESYLGGILNQCIHDGFGLEKFNESLTGPEYAQRYINEVHSLGVTYLLNSIVLEINNKKELLVANRNGIFKFKTKVVILSMGCRERTRGAIAIPGTRPSGIYTAGVAQNLVNLKNYMIGEKIVILGSGDIGLIMARRLSWEGADVMLVAEKLPFCNGLPRNVNQCLHDFDIPLLLSNTIIDIQGEDRLSSVTIAQIDKNDKIIENSAKNIKCDTLLLSIGLIPENELSKKANVKIDPVTGGAVVDNIGQTTIPGIFACGNVLQVHDIVDNVSLEAEYITKGVEQYLNNQINKRRKIKVRIKEGLRYVVPQFLSTIKDTIFSFRVNQPGKNKVLVFKNEGKIFKKISFIRVNPAEMIRVKIKADQLKNVKELTVKLVTK